MHEQLSEPVLRLANREVAVRLAGARDRVGPDLVRRERKAERVQLLECRLHVGDAGDDEVLLACQPDVAAERLDEVGDRDQLVARREPELNGHSDVGEPVLLLGVHADVRGGLRSDRGQFEPLERAAELRLDALEHPVGADVVDHELHARLHARHAVLQVFAPHGRRRTEDLDRVLLRHEDAEVARDAGNRRQSAADLDRVALASVVQHADERDAVDLGRVAAVGAARDRILVLARQVCPRGVAVVRLGRGVDDGRAVEELVGGDAGDGAARDVAHRVAAASGARDPGRLEVCEHVGQRRELEPVQLDALARRQLCVAPAVAVRDLADGAQLGRREDAVRDLHAQHERADLGLVVVEAPPLEADDVLLRKRLVTAGDQRRQLVPDRERRLVELDPLDGIPLRAASRHATGSHYILESGLFGLTGFTGLLRGTGHVPACGGNLLDTRP